jgi:hypothetical protein
MKKAAIILIIIGLGLTVFTAVTFFTRKKVADIGTIRIISNEPHHLAWSPLIGIAVICIGGVVYFLPPKKL